MLEAWACIYFYFYLAVNRVGCGGLEINEVGAACVLTSVKKVGPSVFLG